MAVIKGAFKRKVFCNWGSQYHIYSFMDFENVEHTIIYCGDRPPIVDGEYYCVIRGYRTRSPRYGVQFVLKSIESLEEYDRKVRGKFQGLYEMLA